MIYCIYLGKGMLGVGLGPIHYTDIILLVCGWYDSYNHLKFGHYFYNIDGDEVW